MALDQYSRQEKERELGHRDCPARLWRGAPLPVALRQIGTTGKISLAPSGKSVLQRRPSHPARGTLAIVTNVGGDAVDAAASAREVVAGRVSVSDAQRADERR
jgi:hypothetical protein